MCGLRDFLRHIFRRADEDRVPESPVSDLRSLAARPAPQDAAGWHDEARVLADLGHWEGAIPCLDRALDLDPHRATAWYDKARCLGALGCLEEAIDCYVEALTLDPQMAAAWFSKALAEEKLGYMQDAIRSYEHYLAVGLDEHPEQIEYVQHSLRDLRCSGEAWAESPALRERLSSTPAVQQSPDYSSAREGVTRHRDRTAAAPNARRAKARARVQPQGRSRGRRLQIRPLRIERLAPYLLLIPSGLLLGLIIALIRSCDASEIGFYPSPPRSSNPKTSFGDFSDFAQGSRAYFLGEYDAAIRHFTAALDSHRPVGDVYNRRALAYDAKGEYEKALQDYEQALLAFEQALSPDSGPAMVHNNRACTYIALGEYGKAMTDLSEAIELQSTLGKAYYNRGLVHSSLGDYDAAIEDLSQALLYPASESSLLLNQALAQRPTSIIGDWLEADEMERRFLETGMDRPSTLYQRALAYRGQGEVDSALADLDRAIELLTDRLAKTTTILSRLESTPSSETAVAPEEKDGPENPRVDLPSVYYLRALIYAEKGEYDRAVADMERALELTDDEEMQGQVELALALLRASLAGQGTGLPEDMASSILFGLAEGAGSSDRATAAVPKSTAIPGARPNGTPAPPLPAVYAPQPDETPTTPIWEKPQATCDDKPLYAWPAPGRYLYRETDPDGRTSLVSVAVGSEKRGTDAPCAMPWPNFGEGLAQPPHAGLSAAQSYAFCQRDVSRPAGGVTLTVAGFEPIKTALGVFEAVWVRVSQQYSFPQSINHPRGSFETDEWHVCGYGLVRSKTVHEGAYQERPFHKEYGIELVSFTPTRTNESHVRYIIADCQLGNLAEAYRVDVSDEETAEALRRWDVGVRVANVEDFRRVMANGQWQIVQAGSGATATGAEVILTSDASP